MVRSAKSDVGFGVEGRLVKLRGDEGVDEEQLGYAHMSSCVRIGYVMMEE